MQILREPAGPVEPPAGWTPQTPRPLVGVAHSADAWQGAAEPLCTSAVCRAKEGSLEPLPSEAGNQSLKSIYDRLRQLGAAYCRLETWGHQDRGFRFECEVPVGESPAAFRHFEAVDPDPVQAMLAVVRQLEAYWRDLDY
ncbi:MAG: hypothetical protein ACUVUC_03185 [Thermoguttaceae bacterium]